MARNVEIKAEIQRQDFDQLRSCAEKLATGGPIQLIQTDTFFRSPTGRLKLREFSAGQAELIFYERPDCEGPKTSSYVRSESPAPDTMKEALRGALGVLGVVRKRREVFFVDNTRIHLDQVEGLGTFLELEVVLEENDTELAGHSIANDLLKKLGVAESQLVSGAYFDLLAFTR